jgi:hypothetical protein
MLEQTNKVERIPKVCQTTLDFPHFSLFLDQFHDSALPYINTQQQRVSAAEESALEIGFFLLLLS